MLDWLNNNAAGIQALGAMVGAASTVVLAVLTYKYVSLTRDLSKAAAAQLEHLQLQQAKQSERALRALGTLAIRLRAQTGLLDDTTVHQDRLRLFAGITESDTTELERLSRDTAPPVDGHASLAAFGLRSVLGLIERIKAINPGHGYALSNQESDDYRSALQSANDALDEIIRLAFRESEGGITGVGADKRLE